MHAGKIYGFFLLLSLSFSGCVTCVFDRYPGQRLSSIPAEWSGTYKSDHDSSSAIAGMTFQVSPDTIIINRMGLPEALALNDSMVLSSYRDHYFISFRMTSNTDTLWDVRPFMKTDSAILVYDLTEIKLGQQFGKVLRVLGSYKYQAKTSWMDGGTGFGTTVPVYMMWEDSYLYVLQQASRKKKPIKLVRQAP